MIVWLASYPRSGNTLLRTVLYRCFGLRSFSRYGKVEDDSPLLATAEVTGVTSLPKPWPVFYAEAFAERGQVLVKTHDPPEDSSPALHVVRDGRLACLSYLRFHQSFHPEAARTLEQIVRGEDAFGSWSEHHALWAAHRGPRLELRHEDLVEANAQTLEQLGSFLGCSQPPIPWDNPISGLCAKLPSFFGQGATVFAGDPEWTPSIDRLFWQLHGRLMCELGYG
jgi:hypothetical protein